MISYNQNLIEMDITKCSGEGCPMKESCFRFTAKSSTHQSVFVEVPGWYQDTINKFKNSRDDTRALEWKCEMYWSNDLMSTFEEFIKYD